MTKATLDELFGDVFVTKVTEAKSLATRVEEGVSSYKHDDTISLLNSALDWWRVNAFKYPLLSAMAKMYMGVLRPVHLCP